MSNKKVEQVKNLSKIFSQLNDENKALLLQQAMLILTVQNNGKDGE